MPPDWTDICNAAGQDKMKRGQTVGHRYNQIQQHMSVCWTWVLPPAGKQNCPDDQLKPAPFFQVLFVLQQDINTRSRSPLNLSVCGAEYVFHNCVALGRISGVLHHVTRGCGDTGKTNPGSKWGEYICWSICMFLTAVFKQRSRYSNGTRRILRGSQAKHGD